MTGASKRVLGAVIDLYDLDGWPVSVRDVQAKLGYASTQTVHGFFCDLEREGLIETKPTRRGGWRPTRLGRTCRGV